ncbi:MAG: HD domain-containing protein [Lentisphaeria bacterium]|nr:HD domain-containing protein [Lentisphaeria bacterium]
MIPGKSICIPASPTVDVSAFLPIVEHPLFQRLRERKQLGVNYLVFPGAVHSRFEHAVGTLALTQRLCRVHEIRGERMRTLCAFALLHDIGHGPFSHQIEPILEGHHHQIGLQCLNEMESAVRSCEVDPDELKAMLSEEHPDAPFVSDRNLGTDKLDYLTRDALHIGFAGVPDVQILQFYTDFNHETLAIEEKFIEDIKRLQKFYSYLHQHGYLNKTALTAQRLLQRAVQEEMAADELEPSAFWRMTDCELTAWLRKGRTPIGRDLGKRLAERRLHRSFLVFKPDGYGFVERRNDKSLAVCEWSLKQLRHFSDRHATCQAMGTLENALDDLLGLEHGTILLAAMPYFRKLLPQDVRVFARDSGEGFLLFEKDRAHYRSLESDYLRTFAVRLTAPVELREQLALEAPRIERFLETV